MVSAYYFSHHGFTYVKLDGSMTAAARVVAQETFSDIHPDSPTVFLLSLKAGGVGLNLTAASNVYLMDPVSSDSISLLANAILHVMNNYD